MTPAPFTPNTVARIRELARGNPVSHIARDLQWDSERVLRVAKQFGIEVSGSATDAVLSSSSTEKPIVLPPAQPVHIGPTSGLRLRRDEFDASMTLSEIAEALPQYQGAIVRHLIAIGVDVDFTRTQVIAGRFGTTIASVNSAIAKIKSKMQPTRWTIEGVKQSGYRLVTQSGRMD